MGQNDELILSCPYCSFPLDEKRYCQKCERVMESNDFPPLGFRYKNNAGVGMWPIPKNLQIVKRYEFLETWQSKTTEVNVLVDSILQELLPNGWPKKFDSTKHEKCYEQLRELVINALLENQDIPKVEIEPTAWDSFLEIKSAQTCELRLGEGLYIGLADSGKAAIRAIFAFVGADYVNWPDILKIVFSTGVAIPTLVSCFIRLDDEKKHVFEAISSLSFRQPIHDWESFKKRLSLERLFGNLGPTTLELKDYLAGILKSEVVDKSLHQLSSQGIVKLNDERWYIRF